MLSNRTQEKEKEMFEDLLPTICSNRVEDFLKFAEEGEDQNEFVAHMDVCAKCKQALHVAFSRHIKELHELGEKMGYCHEGE